MYDTFERSSIVETKEESLFDFFLQKRTRRNENRKKHRITTTIAIISLNERDFLSFMTLIGHGGNYSCGTPPQSLVFPFTDIALACLKISSIGTSPSISLNERFNFFRHGSFSKPFGVDPDR